MTSATVTNKHVFFFFLHIESFSQAGLHKDKLTIALEPEAASIFVRHLPVDSKKGSLEISTMPAGTQYIVLDAGGMSYTNNETSIIPRKCVLPIKLGKYKTKLRDFNGA